MRITIWIVCALLLLLGTVWPVCAETSINSLKEVSVETEGGRAVAHIVTDRAVGYRYTVYDSNDPIRVVIDFPRMKLGDLTPIVESASYPIEEVRLSTFDLSLGSLARIELLLKKDAEYRVAFDGNDMQVSFDATVVKDEQEAAAVVEPPPVVAMPVAEATAAEPVPLTVSSDSSADLDVVQADVAPQEVAPETVVQEEATQDVVSPIEDGKNPASVIVGDAQVRLSADGGIEKVRYFTLETPKRLVVDLYGVDPGTETVYLLHDGFDKMRVGPYDDKTRFVFDVSGTEFPKFLVKSEGEFVTVSWTRAQPAAVVKPVKSVRADAAIQTIDFKKQNGTSRLFIGLDTEVDPKAFVVDGNKIQFTLPNTTIPRALRRVFDTVAFPSAIHSATPYLVADDKRSEVRFLVLLKGSAEATLDTEKNQVMLTVNDGAFSEQGPSAQEISLVSVGEPSPPVPSDPVTALLSTEEDEVSSEIDDDVSTDVVAEEKSPAALLESVADADTSAFYTGEKISLVFDNANVKNILQLIAEVSDQNIIASDDVKGNITLRLIDVPWDQALTLVLDIAGLGMEQTGNVVRVMPLEKMRANRQAKLTAVTAAEKLEPTQTEIIPVNYANLGSVSAPARDLLSDRGKITEDQRNKALIVTDVPQRITKISELVQILDTPERQVMIEARIVEVNSNYSRDLGVNWGLSRENDRAGGSSDSMLDVGAGGSFLVGLPAAGGVATSPGLGAGMTFGDVLIDNTILSMRISALEAAGNAKVISTPRVTTLNGEQALISQGTTIPYQSSGDDGLPKTEFVNAELKLEVTPVINPDGSVILEILATNDSPSLTGGTSDAPQIDTKKAETKVMVKDGHTTVIGGIFVENNSTSNSGVPLLKDIPILGNLFKSKSKANTKAELMIFITPRILLGN